MTAEAGAFESPGKAEASVPTSATPEASRPTSHVL